MNLILFSLFTIGIVDILTKRKGPFGIIRYIRGIIPERYNPLLCEVCASVWAGLFYALISWSGFLIYPFTAAGIEIIYLKVLHHIELYLLK